jgi:flagellin FlaB
VELSGPVSVRAAGTSSISNISFYLQLVAHGDGIDMSKVTYSVSTPKKIQTYTSSEVNYTWVKLNNGHTGTTAHSGILSSLEMVLIDINPGFSSTDMTVNDKFMVEVKPPQGPAIPISRTIPAGLATGVWYPVY